MNREMSTVLFIRAHDCRCSTSLISKSMTSPIHSDTNPVSSFSPCFVHGIHILYPHAEDEEVLLSGLLSHLYVGAVHGADGERSVQHELHVASARGLCSRCGDLF